ncbi:MAG: hypothetical protein U0136_21145 [Bdellovibrionota bacterium]
MIAPRTIARLIPVSIVVGVRIISSRATPVGILVVLSAKLLHPPPVQVDTALSAPIREVLAIVPPRSDTLTVKWAASTHLVGRGGLRKS